VRGSYDVDMVGGTECPPLDTSVHQLPRGPIRPHGTMTGDPGLLGQYVPSDTILAKIGPTGITWNTFTITIGSHTPATTTTFGAL